jgi:hypothetical protein
MPAPAQLSELDHVRLQLAFERVNRAQAQLALFTEREAAARGAAAVLERELLAKYEVEPGHGDRIHLDTGAIARTPRPEQPPPALELVKQPAAEK